MKLKVAGDYIRKNLKDLILKKYVKVNFSITQTKIKSLERSFVISIIHLNL